MKTPGVAESRFQSASHFNPQPNPNTTMQNPYKAPANATLAELRALAFAAFADHKSDLKTDRVYKRIYLSQLSDDNKAKNSHLSL